MFRKRGCEMRLYGSYWQERQDGAVLWSADGELIALIEKVNDLWECTIYPELISEYFRVWSDGSIEEMELKMTLHINRQCNKMEKQLYEIQDNLPNIHELIDRARRNGEK